MYSVTFEGEKYIYFLLEFSKFVIYLVSKAHRDTSRETFSCDI